MKQLITTLTSPPKKLKTNRKIKIWILLPIGVVTTFFLLSFSFPNFSHNSFAKSLFESDHSKVSCTVNNSVLEGSSLQEAILTRMEQIDGVYSKTLNLSMSDENGNLVAITITDVQNENKSTCLNLGSFYGNEHEKADLNYAVDLGQVVFTNNCSLILEGKSGNSIISRNGFVDIESCKDGMLSGSFKFEIGSKNNVQISSGLFENVNFTTEGF